MHEAGPVASPIAPCPPRALVKELCARLQGGFDFAFGVVLDPSLPIVSNQPASDKIVVVGIEYVFPPFLILEAA